MTRTDILSPADITKLVGIFYGKLLTSGIKHHFAGLHLESHLPRIESFWNATLFPDHSYAQNLMEKHMHLPLKKEDFGVWLDAFLETVDELFSGPNAAVVKNRAASIAYIMQKKIVKD